MPIQWTCIGVDPQVCDLTATSTEPVVMYHDWLFVNLVLIFLLSFLAWGFLTSGFKKHA